MSSRAVSDQINVCDDGLLIDSFSYYEYKYLVPHENLRAVIDVLTEFYGGTDPYPQGVVDSIYYDNYPQSCLESCLDGMSQKSKFRIRGYGQGVFGQIHQKMKDIAGVSKYKAALQPVSVRGGVCPEWEDLRPKEENDHDFQVIYNNSLALGPLIPSIRVKYDRHRFRSYDYRITLDTNIQVFNPFNGIPRALMHAILPYHVLEIKTEKLRPKLPFVGLIKLTQVSFSKFMLGIKMLQGENPVL